MLNVALRRDFHPLCCVSSSLLWIGVPSLTLECPLPHIPSHSLNVSEKGEGQNLYVLCFFVLPKH